MDKLIEIEKPQIIIPKCEISKTGLIFNDSIAFNEWKDIGSLLKQVEGSVQFWIGDWLNFGKRKYEHGKYEQALQELEYEKQALKDFCWVSESIETSLRKDNLEFSHHKEVASLPPEEQQQWLETAEQEQLTVRELREQIKEVKKQKAPPLPQGKYFVIYADPPWQYQNEGFDESAEQQYPTIPVEEICALPIRGLITDKAVLFLWVTNAFLKEGIQVCEAWGFSYKTNFAWIKNKGPSIGWFSRSRHELLFIATKGDGVHPVEKYLSWFEAEVTKHSKKPALVYEMIEKMYPGPYVELFARQKRDGWENWGNEIID